MYHFICVRTILLQMVHCGIFVYALWDSWYRSICVDSLSGISRLSFCQNVNDTMTVVTHATDRIYMIIFTELHDNCHNIFPPTHIVLSVIFINACAITSDIYWLIQSSFISYLLCFASFGDVSSSAYFTLLYRYNIYRLCTYQMIGLVLLIWTMLFCTLPFIGLYFSLSYIPRPLLRDTMCIVASIWKWLSFNYTTAGPFAINVIDRTSTGCFHVSGLSNRDLNPPQQNVCLHWPEISTDVWRKLEI